MESAVTPAVADYMSAYMLRGQHQGDRAMTRYRHDLNKMIENNEISTGPGRYVLGVPNRYGNATFVPTPSVLNQKWGAAHDMSSTKTDVESDLRNIGRPGTRVACGQYTPAEGAARRLTAMPETDFPHTFERLVDPPCTLRGSGWNRWEWLCQNPQDNVMIPFEHQITGRRAAKDGVYTSLARGVSAVPTEPLVCGIQYTDPAVPVVRTQAAGAPQNFNDAVPGASQRLGHPPPAQERARGAPPAGVANPNGPPRSPPQIAEGQALERKRAETGVLAAPAPFTVYIADHVAGRQ
jgi:hypothetical protein